MPKIETPSTSRRGAQDSRPRHPYREIADLLAAAIARARTKSSTAQEATAALPESEVCLGFTANQSVHTNPSYAKGVRE